MKTKTLFLIFILCFVLKTSVFAGDLTPGQIVKKASYASLYQGDDLKGKMSIQIKDRLGRKRSRLLNMMRKNTPGTDDQKYFVFFLRPADVKKMVFMVLKYGELKKDDDRWLYLPGLDLVKRIAASDKRTSFAGSDFLYEDISGRNPEEDSHFMDDETDKLYVVKSVPKEKNSVEFEYYKAYIDKKTFIPLKVEYFKKNDRLYRRITAKKIDLIKALKDGKEVFYPTVTVSLAEDLDTKSVSEMSLGSIKYNSGIKDRFFSERFLRKPPRMILR